MAKALSRIRSVFRAPWTFWMRWNRSMAAGKADTTALITRTQANFTQEKVWSAEELDALFSEARALRAERAQHFIALRLKLRESLNEGEWAAAFPES